MVSINFAALVASTLALTAAAATNGTTTTKSTTVVSLVHASFVLP